MSSYWCDSCQDYHDTEDDAYVNPDPTPYEEPPMPIEMPVDNSLPTRPGNGIWAYATSVIHATSSPQEYIDLYAQTCTRYSPPNIDRWMADNMTGQYVAWSIPTAEVQSSAREILRSALRSVPFGDKWCTNSPEYALPYKWAGQYVAAAQSRDGRNIYAISETRYTCAHCAIVAAKERGAELATLLNYTVNQPIEEYNLPPNTAEIVGEVCTTTATIKDMAGAELQSSCGNCGRIGHRSSTCTYPEKSFLKVGIEIEGRFLDIHEVTRRANRGNLGHNQDSSIQYSPDNEACSPMEFQTEPGSIRHACQQLIDFYPDETDRSCGMHVHVSFNAADVMLLNTPAFFAYFKQRWNEWGTRMNLDPNGQFFRRLNGRNTFCRVITRTVDYQSQDRYSQLNFSAWSDHKTLECRLLPMFKRTSLGVAAVQELLAIYEDFLHAADTHLDMPTYDTANYGGLAVAPIKEVMPTKELEIVPMREAATSFTMELSEVLPPAEGMVRIALPVNQQITLTALASAVRQRRAS